MNIIDNHSDLTRLVECINIKKINYNNVNYKNKYLFTNIIKRKFNLYRKRGMFVPLCNNSKYNYIFKNTTFKKGEIVKIYNYFHEKNVHS